MSKYKIIFLSITIFILCLVGVYVYAAREGVFHSADEVEPGRFANGDYTFRKKLNVNGQVSSPVLIATNKVCLGTDCIKSWPKGLVTGSGTVNRIPLWTGSSRLGNSAISQWSDNIGVNGSALIGGAVNSQLFYDTNNSHYKVDPNDLSRLKTIYAEGEIKSTTKSEWKDVPISTIRAYQPLCNHTDLSNQKNLLYCISGCQRYCSDGLGYSGGTLTEYDGNNQRVGCICIP
jgi:hypothetical protein